MNGALLVDKPAGVTSHDVVAVARRALRTKSVGHTGTLDPFATGLLVLLVGKATRLARFLDGCDKEYEATIRLGQGSDTDDATGALTPAPATAPRPSATEVRSALDSFLGTSRQVPPAYSAKKVAGERAYARARKGEAVALQAAEVTVHRIDLRRYAWPDIELRAVVSTGTYVRSLARDLGTRLGTLAHCAALRRTRIGRFEVAQAIPLDALQEASPEQLLADGRWLMPHEVVAHLPVQELEEGEAASVRTGRKVATREAEGPVALVHRGALLAVAEVRDGMAQPSVVLAE